MFQQQIVNPFKDLVAPGPIAAAPPAGLPPVAAAPAPAAPGLSAQNLLTDIYLRVLVAFASAGAAFQYAEDLRSNTEVAVLGAQTINAGVAITNTTNLPEGSFIRSFSIHDANSGLAAADPAHSVLMLNSLTVNTWDCVRGGPVPLSILSGYRTNQQRIRPLTGRIWRSAIPLAAIVSNPTPNPIFFGGLVCDTVNNECTPATGRSYVTYGFKSLMDGQMWAAQLVRVLQMLGGNRC